MKVNKPVKHVLREGSRDHVVSWDSKGAKCSVPNCEINAHRDTATKRAVKEYGR